MWRLILEKVNYQEHQWMVCGDFKILTMLLGQQAGYTKHTAKRWRMFHIFVFQVPKTV
jgi:hypothetical protein